MGSLKGVDDFIILLVIAFIILGGLLVVSRFIPFGTVQNITIAEYSLGTIGFISDLPAKSLDIGDIAIGATQREILKSVPVQELAASVLGGQPNEYMIEVIQPKLDIIKDIRISFTVTETNNYGRLVITWNGKEVYKDFAKGTVTVRVDPDNIKSSNVLKVYTEGPGWLFWAASVYELAGFNVEVGYGPTKITAFELDTNEVTSFTKGVIDFYARGEADSLVITLNGIDIYRQLPSGMTTIEFNYTSTPLRVGINLLAFSAPRGQMELLGTGLKIYLFGKESVMKREFNMTKENLALLQQGAYRGRIDFYINQIGTPGTFKIGLNNALLTIPSIKSGYNSIFFNPEDVMEGMNRIVFSGTGSFDVDWAKIIMIR